MLARGRVAAHGAQLGRWRGRYARGGRDVPRRHASGGGGDILGQQRAVVGRLLRRQRVHAVPHFRRQTVEIETVDGLGTAGNIIVFEYPLVVNPFYIGNTIYEIKFQVQQCRNTDVGTRPHRQT